MDAKMENCHYFSINFTSMNKDIQGRLFSTCDGTIEIDFNNGFEEFEVCSTEYISNDDVYLGGKDKFIELQKGNAIVIRNNVVIITEIDYETITEFNEFCDRCDMEYC